jgi:hypothetical protein
MPVKTKYMYGGLTCLLDIGPGVKIHTNRNRRLDLHIKVSAIRFGHRDVLNYHTACGGL